MTRCCCGRIKEFEEGVGAHMINKTVHEPLGEPGAFCGPVDAHTIRDQAREIQWLRDAVIAFGGIWAAEYADKNGYPDGHIHPRHYDVLARAGARMDSFTRSSESETKEK